MVLSLFLLSGTAFADTPKDGDPQPAQAAKKKSTKPAKSATAILAEQVEALRQTLEAQQQQIRQLQEELTKRDAQIGDAKSAAAAADAKASEATVAGENGRPFPLCRFGCEICKGSVTELITIIDSALSEIQPTLKRL